MTPAPVGLRCPDHSGKPQGIQKVTATATRATTGIGSRHVNAVTMALIGINVLVYFSELAAGGTVNGLGNTIYEHGALYGPLVAHGDWWRLITSAFLHYGPFHLAINMYSLYFAGSILEQVIGRWRFALLYLASGLAGAAGALVLAPNVPTGGASGGNFCILGRLFVLPPRRDVGRAGAGVEPDPVAERHRARPAAVLPADADLELGLGAASALDGDAHQLADARLVEHLERIAIEHAVLEVAREELAFGVV